MSKLNEKQKAFADYYIESLNATESYKIAYNCSYNTARTNGARLLANANIKEYIDEVMSAKDESRIASQDEILQILTDIARGVTEEEVVQFSQLGEELRTTRKPTIKDRMGMSSIDYATLFKKEEILNHINWLQQFENIIIKFGRYIPNQGKHFDEILGIWLSSDNQYAEEIS